MKKGAFLVLLVCLLHTFSAASQVEERESETAARPLSPDLLLDGSLGFTFFGIGLQGSLIYRWQNRYVLHARVGKYYSGLGTFLDEARFRATEYALMPGLHFPIGSSEVYYVLELGPALYALSEHRSANKVEEDRKWGLAAETGFFWEHRRFRLGVSLSVAGTPTVNPSVFAFFHVGINLLK